MFSVRTVCFPRWKHAVFPQWDIPFRNTKHSQMAFPNGTPPCHVSSENSVFSRWEQGSGPNGTFLLGTQSIPKWNTALFPVRWERAVFPMERSRVFSGCDMLLYTAIISHCYFLFVSQMQKQQLKQCHTSMVIP